jgi:hypothetical protein
MKVFAVVLSFAFLINIASSLSTAVAQTAVGQAKAKMAKTATTAKSTCPRFGHSRACYWTRQPVARSDLPVCTGRSALPHLLPRLIARPWLNGHRASVHLPCVAPLKAPGVLAVRQRSPSFGLTKPFAAVLRVRLGPLTVQILHAVAVCQIAHAVTPQCPAALCAQDRKLKRQERWRFGSRTGVRLSSLAITSGDRYHVFVDGAVPRESGVSVREICRDYFPHLGPTKFVRKAGEWDIVIPTIRMEASQKAANIKDLAAR